MEKKLAGIVVYFVMEGVRSKYSLVDPCQAQRGRRANVLVLVLVHVHLRRWTPSLLYTNPSQRTSTTSTSVYSRSHSLVEAIKGPAESRQDVLLLATPPVSFATAFDFRKLKLRIGRSIPDTSRENQREKGRTGELEAVERSQRRVSRANANAGREAGYAFRWH